MKRTLQGLSSLLVLLFIVGSVSFAQDARTAITNAYNAAQEKATAGSYEEAIKEFEDVYEDAEEAGLADIQDLVVGQLPRIYSAKASEAYKAFQANQTLETIDAAIEAFQDAQEAATEYGESSIAAQMANNIPQLYYVKSLVQYRQEDLEGASATLDLAIAANSNYAQAYFQKAIVMRNQGKATTDVVAMFDQAITLADMYGQGQVATRATNQAVQTLLSAGAQAVQDNQLTQGIDLLTRAAGYETDEADVFFRLAEAYNKRSLYNDAVTNAQKALELESGGVADKAKIYFELGFAYQMQNNKDAACSAMKNASYGQFRDPANHKMEFELKCPGTSGS